VAKRDQELLEQNIHLHGDVPKNGGENPQEMIFHARSSQIRYIELVFGAAVR
jgi:hypothetical protein